MPIGTIIAALIGAGSSLYAGEQSNLETERAREEARGLSQQSRADQLRQNAITNRYNEKGRGRYCRRHRC